MSGKQLASIIADLPQLQSCYLDNGDGHFYHADFLSKFLEPHALQSAGRLHACEPALSTEAVHASIAAAVAARSSSRQAKCADAAALRLSVNLTELQLEDSFFDSADLRALLATLPHLRRLRLDCMPALESALPVILAAPCCEVLESLHIARSDRLRSELQHSSLLCCVRLRELILPAGVWNCVTARRQWRIAATRPEVWVQWMQRPMEWLQHDESLQQLLWQARTAARAGGEDETRGNETP
jgi:hypothetical protein